MTSLDFFSPAEDFRPGGSDERINLISQNRLAELGEETQKNTIGIQSTGASLSQYYQNMLLLMQLHVANSTNEQVFKTTSDTVNVFTQKIRELAAKDNVLTQYATQLEESLAKIKTEILAHTDTSPSNTQPETMQRIVGYLSGLAHDSTVFVETIYKATLDLKKARPYLINKTQQTFTPDDVIRISNYSIFEEIDYELGRVGQLDTLKNHWTLLEPRFYNLFKQFPVLKRVDLDKKQMIHKEPQANNTTVNFNTIGQTEYEGIPLNDRRTLERSIGLLLSEFYSLNDSAIKKLPPSSVLRKYCPPFCEENYKVKNIYVHNLISDGNSANLIIGPPSRGNGYSFMPAEGCCRGGHDYASYQTPNFDLHVTKGGEFSLERRCGFASGCGDTFGRGGRATKKRARRPYVVTEGYENGEDDSDSSSEDEYDSDEGTNATPPKRRRGRPTLKSVTDSLERSRSASTRTMESLSRTAPTNTIIELLQRISHNLKFIKSTDYSDFQENLLALAANFEMIMAIENVFLNTENKRPLAISAQMLEESLLVYENLVMENTTVSDILKGAYRDTYNQLKAARETMKDAENRPSQSSEIYLDPTMYYTKHLGVVFQFWRQDNVIQQIVRATFTQESVFSNKHTAFSMGKLNRYDNNFEFDENKRLVKFKQTGEVTNAVNSFKVSLRQDFYENLADKLERAFLLLSNSCRQLEETARSIFPLYNGQPKYKQFLELIMKHDDCGQIGDMAGFRKMGKNLDAYVAVTNVPKNLKSVYGMFEEITEPKPSDLCIFQKILRNEAPDARLIEKDQHKDFVTFIEHCQRLYNARRALKNAVFSQLTVDEVKLSGVYETQFKKYREMAEYIARLRPDSFEKRFSTPVVSAEMKLVDAFIRMGYGEFIKSPFSMNLYFMGPSGSGKTYNQYGDMGDKVIGLDTRFLDLERQTMSFRDVYAMSFYAYDSFRKSFNTPVYYHYSFAPSTTGESTNVSSLVNYEGDSKPRDIQQKNLANFRAKIERQRENLDLVRETIENPKGSSRSFFLLGVTQEGGIEKNMIDTPGYEPINRPSYTNPFVFIHDYLVKILGNGQNLSKSRTQKEWATNALGVLSKQLAADFALSTDTWLNGTSIQLPKPSTYTASTTGETLVKEYGLLQNNTTFEDFIKSSLIGVNTTFVSNMDTEKYWDEGVNHARKGQTSTIIKKNKSISFTNYDWIKKQERYMAIVYGDGATNNVQEFDKLNLTPFATHRSSAQNICLDYRLATIVYFTWRLFDALFGSGCKNVTRAIKEVFLGKIVAKSGVNPDHVKQALEAVFINQFNFWAQHATLKQNNQSLVDYLKSNNQANDVSLGDLFYEYLYLISDLEFTGPGLESLSPFPRHAYAQLGKTVLADKKPWANQVEDVSNFGFQIKITADCLTDWDLNKALELYDTHSRLYNPYVPLGDLSCFDNFLTKTGKNMFITILNSEKIRTYNSFFDINPSTKTNELTQRDVVKDEPDLMSFE